MTAPSGAAQSPTLDSVVAQPSTTAGTSSAVARSARTVLWASGWPARTILLTLISVYRRTLSGVMGGHCRFEPTCSAYAAAAIRGRGAFVGSGLAIWRILRCNPFARGGVDPPPVRAEYDHLIQRKPA